MKTYSIKETTKLTGITSSALRYYESEQLITPLRSENNYRRYHAHDIRLLKYISVMKFADFTLEEMRYLLELMASPISEACNEKTKKKFDEIISNLQSKINHLSEIVSLLHMFQSENVDSFFEENGSAADGFIEKIFNQTRKDY